MSERRVKPDSPCEYGRPGQYMARELETAWEAYDAAVLATRDEPRAGYFFGRPDTSNRLDVDPWSPDDIWT